MRATVVVFPGSNAEAELVRTLRVVCGVDTRVAWHHDTSLPEGTDLVALPGGFRYREPGLRNELPLRCAVPAVHAGD